MAQPDLDTNEQNFLKTWMATPQRHMSTQSLLPLADRWGIELQGMDPLSRAASLDAWLRKLAGREINLGGDQVIKIEEQANTGGHFNNWLISDRHSYRTKHIRGID